MASETTHFLSYHDRTYAIYGNIKDTKNFVNGKGYIDDNGNVYIYTDRPISSAPYFMKNEETGEISYHNMTPLYSTYFNKDHIGTLSFKELVDNTTGNEVLYNTEALEDMNLASSIYVPTINDDDDPLKKIIKQAIIDKHIDLNRLKHKMPQKYGLTNMKSALIGKTKMSIFNFMIWCELLGLDFKFIVTDNDTDKINPLTKTISFDSTDGLKSE